MYKAFMLLEVEPGREDYILKESRKIEGVKVAHLVTGMYDIVLEVNTEEKGSLKNVVERVRAIEGIRSTQTLITIHSI